MFLIFSEPSCTSLLTKMKTENINSIHLALKEPSIKKKKIKVKQLIATGADLNERNEHLETSLHVAISQGWEDIAAELIAKMPMKILNAICGFGLTPLYLAIEKNQFKIVQLLLKTGASVNIPSYVGNFHRVTSLQLALQLKNYKMINLLLGYEPEVGKNEAADLLTLSLKWVVKKDFRNILKLMFKGRQDAKRVSRKFFEELLTLAKSPEMGKILLKEFYGHDILMKFEIALSYNMIGIIEYFIKNEVGFMDKVDNSGKTSLHRAVISNQPQIVELLIKYGFNINAKCNHGCTPLHYAVSIGTEIILKILLENGADIDAKTLHLELTPLMGAIMDNRLSIAKVLIEHGASLKKRNIDGMSPLEIALQQKKFDIALMIPHCESK